MRRGHIKQKGYQIVEMWCVSGGVSIKLMHQSKVVSQIVVSHSLLSEEQLLQRQNDGKLFGYVQCDIEVPEHLAHMGIR